MNGIKIFQTLSAQKSKKNEDNNHSIVVSSVAIILKKYLEYYNNSNNNTTWKTIIKTLFFSEGIIRLVFIKTEYVQRITINILSSNLTMWDLSLCPRTLQDQEFNGEQNDELCSFHSRTSSHKKPSKWISCQEYQKEKVHLISYGTYYEKERQKGFDNGLKKKDLRRDQTKVFMQINNSCMISKSIYFLYQQIILTWPWTWRVRTKRL